MEIRSVSVEFWTAFFAPEMMLDDVVGARIKAVHPAVPSGLALFGIAEGAKELHFGFFQQVSHFDFHNPSLR